MKRLLIGVGVLALIIFCCIAVARYENQKQAALAAKIGDVAITPEMTLADYRKALGRETSADTASDVGVAVSNGVDFQFANGMVIISFIGTDPAKITPGQKPIFVQIDPTFEGTICGVHTTDSLPRALYFLQRRYPEDRVSADFDSSHEVDLDGDWSIKLDPSGVGSGSKVGGIILKDTRWGTVPTNTGP